MSNKRVAALAQALKSSGKTPTEIAATLGLDAALLQPRENEMNNLSRATVSRIVLALKSNNALAMDTENVAEILRQIENLEGDRPSRAFDAELMPNGGIPAWLKEHPDDADDAFDSREEEEEDNAADRRARDARSKRGRDETEEEIEEREEEEEKEADDALCEVEDSHREAEDSKHNAEDRKRAEDRHRKAMDRLRKLGADARRRAEDRKAARDRVIARARDAVLEPVELYKPDTSCTLDAVIRHTRDRRHLSRDYRRARDAHRRAHDLWRRYADDYHRAHDACKEAEDRRREAEDTKRTDDAKRAENDCREAEDRMRRAGEDARRAEDALHRARDARRKARDARRAHDRRRADDEPPELKPFLKAEGDKMVTKAAMDAAIADALRDNDYRHRSIVEALEVVRPKVGKIAMDASIRSEGDVYSRALDILGVPHAGIVQLGALKQIFAMAASPGTEIQNARSGFAMDSAPSSATDFQRFKQLFPAAANIQRM